MTCLPPLLICCLGRAACCLKVHRAEQFFCMSREWAIVDADGEALTQKRLPKLATIKPVLNLEEGDPHILLLLPSLQ